MKKFFENKKVRIPLTIIKILLSIILIMMLLVVVVQRVTNNNLTLGGYRIFIVVSESMLPHYEIGDVLVSKEKEAKDIKKGDDVVYLGEKNDLADRIITHRVIKVSKGNDGYSFITKGTNNPTADPEISEDQIYGVVSNKLFVFSYVGKIMSTSLGYFGLFIGASILVSYQLVKAFFIKDEEDDDKDEENDKENN